MKKTIISFIHQPKKVITVSLVIAIIIGIFGYININKEPIDKFIKDNNSEMKNTALSFVATGKVKNIPVKKGDTVKKGQVLVTLNANNKDGSLIQAESLYETAKANYQKVINGATGTSVDLAKSIVNTAQVNLNEITKQQQILVDNAYINLLNSNPEAFPNDNIEDYNKPIISGNYNLGKEGTIKLVFYYSAGGVSFNVSGIASGTNSCNTTTSQPIGNSGLYIKCSSNNIEANNWNMEIPNKNAANYNLNNNAYQLALQNKEQAIASASATLEQVKASLNLVAANARPEDVATAQAQVDSAYGALISNPGYTNAVILAPSDGTVVDVYVKEGETILPNTKVIDLLGLINKLTH